MFLDELARVLRLNVPADQKIKLAERETEKIILAEEELERKRIIDLQDRFRGRRRGNVPSHQELSAFGAEETIDLGIARNNFQIYNRPFTSVSVTELLPIVDNAIPLLYGATRPKAYFRFNKIESPMYRIRYGEVKGTFDKLYLTNVSQPGYGFSYVIGDDDEKYASFNMRGDINALLENSNVLRGGIASYRSLEDLFNEIEKYNLKNSPSPGFMGYVNITNPNAEYELEIPIHTKMLKVGLQDLSVFRLAWETGKVAAPTLPYWTQPPNTVFELNNLLLTMNKTLYVASPVGTKVCIAHYSR